MEQLKRNQTQLLNAMLLQFPAIGLIGARQVGKTTLAQQLRPDWTYIDLENPNDFESLTRDPVLFFQQHPDQLIIDEAQRYPQLFEILRGQIDQNRNQSNRFIITGSSSHELTQAITESLAGRIASAQIGTLKANELFQKPLSPFYQLFEQKLDRKNLITGQPPLTTQQTHQAWLQGGYPKPVLHTEKTFWPRWMEQYHFNYIQRDIAQLFPRLNKFKYQQFIKILASLSGTIINKSNLARALEISEGSVREYMKITEGTFLWRELQSYAKNPTKSLIKMPKGYYRDTGLLHYLMNIRTSDDLYHHQIVGQSFEAFVIEEILKGLEASDVTGWQPYYYRTKRGVEIDLILEGYFGTLPIEIKYSSTASQRDIRALESFVTEHHLPFGILINQSNETLWLSEKILQIPAGWI